MKKNISISIGGIIFHIEEDGYDKLKNYLDSINKYFSSFEDSKEIIEDIEGRIAEIFLAKLDDGKQIITQEDVEDLVATMGTTKDFDATIETEPKEEASEENQQAYEEPQGSRTYEKSKRLYRDKSRKVIGGVASGLANYFGVDPIWIRLLMLALLFNVFFWGLSSFIFIAYIVLWIVIPGTDSLEEDKTVKKLFRDKDDKVLGGVSSGIASYFGMDPVVIRILFVVSIFIGGAGLIAYILLWIITPEARTITERMQMQGEPVTLTNIEENVKKSLNVKEGEESAFVKILLFPFRLIALIFKALGKALGPLLRFLVEALRIGAGVFLVFLGFVLMLSFTGSLIVLLGMGDALESYFQFGDFPADELFNSLGIIATISSYLSLMVPSLGIALLGLVIILKRKVISAYIAWSLFGLWLMGMVGLAFTLPKVIANYSADGSFKEERTFLVEETIPTLRLNDLDLRRFDAVDLQIRGYQDSARYTLEMDFESRGYSKANARENAEAVDYLVTAKDGDFYFDSNLTSQGAPFRFQKLDATFYIPYGKVFRMDDELKAILRNTLWIHDYSADEMEDNDWVFEEDGKLQCLTCEKRERRSYKNGYEEEEDGRYRTFQFEDFDEVKLISMFDFEIARDNKFAVRLEGDERDLDEVYLKQEGEELEIRYKKDWEWWGNKNFSDKVKVLISMPALENLNVSGACKGEVRDFKNENISFRVEGASEVRADISPQYFGAELNGASELILIGEADELEVDLNGASKLNAFDFKVRDADINANGASSARVNVKEELNADASGASTIRYRGSAKVSADSNGLSSVKKD